MELSGRTAVITGAASGQGLASAWRFAAAGARLALIDWNRAEGEKLAAALSAAGHQVLFCTADLGVADQVRAACAQVTDWAGAVDILFNNAAVGYSENARYPMVDTLQTSLEGWNDILRINLTGAMLMTQALLPGMLAQQRGAIINNVSVAGLRGVPGIDAYTASKGALIALTRAWAASYGPQGVRVNAIAPGSIDTPMLRPVLADGAFDSRLSRVPLRRLGTPDDIAGLALFLASDGAAYVTGQVIACDGGRIAT